MNKPIPLNDVKKQNAGIARELRAAVRRVFSDSVFVGGPSQLAFEAHFARYCGCAHAVGCSSGTAALQLALLGLGIGPGDEVITTPYTFTATLEAILHTGARPVLVDIDPPGFSLDPRRILRAITARTKAVLPVHLYGNPCDMTAIRRIAKARRLLIVEDCAQAHGARHGGRRVGSLGNAGCFSFYPGKNLGACGDAGAVVTDQAAVADTIRGLANHGRKTHSEHDRVGFNFRMDALQAAVLDVKLRHLPGWTRTRQRLAARYRAKLRGVRGIALPVADPRSEHVYHLFVIRAERRDDLLAHLIARNIAAVVHYPLPLHLQPAYRFLGYRAGAFPAAEAAARQVLSLPLYTDLSRSELDYIADAVRSFYA
jgi:dTDP-4-amino-4,6-dideoxygalactose transaminase